MKYIQPANNKSHKTRILAIFFSFVLLLSQTPVASALSDAYREKFEMNDIVFYDPESECTPAAQANNVRCTTSGSGSVPDGSKITWIGDSYSEAMASEIQSTFSGVDFHALYSKKFKTDGTSTTGGKSGLNILKDDVGSNLREYLVFALGTNMDAGTKSAFASQIEELKTLATSLNSNVKIILVSPRTRTYEYTDYTEAMKEAAAADDNIFLADWNAESKDHLDEYFDGRCNIGDGYQDNCTHPNSTGYAKWLELIQNALGGGGSSNCTAGMLAGNTVEERIWNWFVSANISGVSDNPAVIAGILGNFYVESGYNPFMLGSSGESYRGLWMLYLDYGGATIRDRVNAAVGSDHWKFYGWWGDYQTVDQEMAKEFSASQSEVDTAVQVELEYLTSMEYSTWQWFLDGLNEVSNTSGAAGAESYAELFLGIVENAFGGGDGGGTLNDSKVQSYVSRKWGSSHTTWQGAAKRRAAAVDAYNRLSNQTTAATTTTTTTASGTTTTTTTQASSGGFTKYQLTDDEIWDLAEVGMHENDINLTAFKNEISLIANLYEKNSGSYNSPWDYVAHSNWFATKSYANLSHDDNVPSDHIEAVRDILINGNRTIPTQIVEHDCLYQGACTYGIAWAYDISDTSESNDLMSDPGSWKSGQTKLVQADGSGNRVGEWIFYDWMGGSGWQGSNSASGDPMGYFADNPPSSIPASSSSSSSSSSGNICPGSSSTVSSSTGGAGLVAVALSMAWPVMSGQGDDTHVGQCETSSGNWVSWDSSASSCYHYPRELYVENKAKYNTGCGDDTYEDCGYFMATVLYAAGVDENGTAPKCGTEAINNFLSSSSNWESVTNDGTETNLKPGDIFVTPSGHVSMYAGSYGGSYGKQVHASRDDRVGTLTNYVANQSGGKWVDSNGAAFNIYRIKGAVISEGGLTYEQAKQLMINYGANKNDSSHKATDQLWMMCSSHSDAGYTGGSNCVTFSAFFLNMFTDTHVGNAPGDGHAIVGNLASRTSTGTEPKPFAVFSWSNGSYGHTGVILGYQNGEWIVGHASCSNSGYGAGNGTKEGGGSGFVMKSSNITEALWGINASGYAYPTVDTARISEYLVSGE